MTVHGARISMAIGLMATMITVVFGAVLGIIAGYVGGRTDTVIMRISDFFLVLPTIVLAIILAPVILDVVGADAEFFGIRATMIVIVVVIGLTSWAVTARIVRSQVLSIKMRMFVDRARVVGSGPGRIMRRHVLPNVINLIVAQAVLTFAVAVFTETTLAFIGLGDPFAPSWGEILNSAQSAGAPGLGAWWYIVPPAVCVVLVVLAFTLVGNALDDVLNPKSGARR
jgi:peptide/nickel transport system permease protein